MGYFAMHTGLNKYPWNLAARKQRKKTGNSIDLKKKE